MKQIRRKVCTASQYWIFKAFLWPNYKVYHVQAHEVHEHYQVHGIYNENLTNKILIIEIKKFSTNVYFSSGILTSIKLYSYFNSL